MALLAFTTTVTSTPSIKTSLSNHLTEIRKMPTVANHAFTQLSATVKKALSWTQYKCLGSGKMVKEY